MDTAAFTPCAEVEELVMGIKRLSVGNEFFENKALYDHVEDLIEKHLIRESDTSADLAPLNSAYLISQGIPVEASNPDESGFWCGIVSVGSAYKIYFKYTGQQACGV
ncbi:hypothetical protein GCM10009425_41280 [Pseudomonas asuensis]|uniref:Uncharacterized protein n=1 Tax=Pseudomonas asuensis TaxID=1825787 RepID=A0ABQ2H2S9_9PSED|nr:hypothetical protein [Pseudomonas asuensis]GGM26372.1 hypothetical protein GCM10009425_41280 [Pseudomonas asuensis]